MNFKQACVEAAINAKEKGVHFYIYDSPTMWDVTASFRPGWLFCAYPGGRNILSPAGAKLMQEMSADYGYCGCTFYGVEKIGLICERCGGTCRPPWW